MVINLKWIGIVIPNGNDKSILRMKLKKNNYSDLETLMYMSPSYEYNANQTQMLINKVSVWILIVNPVLNSCKL